MPLTFVGYFFGLKRPSHEIALHATEYSSVSIQIFKNISRDCSFISRLFSLTSDSIEMHELCYIPSVFHNSPRHTFFLSNISASLLFPDITHEFSYVPLKNHSPFFITSKFHFEVYFPLSQNQIFLSLSSSQTEPLFLKQITISYYFSSSHSDCLYSPCLTLAVSILPVSL